MIKWLFFPLLLLFGLFASFDLLLPKGPQGTRPRGKGDLLRPLWLPSGEKINLAPDPQGTTTIRTPFDLRVGRSFLPRVAILFGRRGQGKTLWLTTMLWILKEMARMNGTPRKVLTNYWTSFSDIASPYLLDDLQEFPDYAYNAIIGIDEIVDLLPSARAMSNFNLLSATFARQIRKRGCEIIAATQFPQELSRAILRQCDFFLETELIDNGKGVRTYWHDWWGQITGQYKQRYWPPERDSHDFAFTLWGTDQIFGHYRTEEVVASVYSENRDDIIEAQWGSTFGTKEEGGDIPVSSRKTFAEILEMVREHEFEILVDDLLEPAQQDLSMPYLSDSRLRQILINMGFTVEQDEHGDWVVSK